MWVLNNRIEPDGTELNAWQEAILSQMFVDHFNQNIEEIWSRVKSKIPTTVAARFCWCWKPLQWKQKMCSECRIRARG